MELNTPNEISLSQALNLCVLVLEPENWIHRRVEQVAYLDHNTIRRRITVDFDVPNFGVSPNETLYVPIAQFAKHKLVNFDMSDADGTSLTMLTAEQNGRLSTALLMALARLYGNENIDGITEKYISLLVRATTGEERTRAWTRIFQAGTATGEHLLRRSGFVAVATDLRTNFILYLPVTAEEAGRRKIVKIAFDAPRPAVERTGLFVRLGWRGAEDSFRVPLAGYCSSYHFELEAPSEMEIIKGRFVGTRQSQTVEDLLSSPTRRAHFNLSRLDRAGGRVAIRLRARSSMLGGAALLSAMNALTLCFVLLRLHAFTSTSGDNGASIVAALVAIPGILIGYITRPTEHAMVTSFLADLRFVALLSALTSFVGAVILFAGYSEDALDLIFAVLSTVALLSFLALLISWLVGRPTGSDRPSGMVS
jgi:hypothetical protein